jgi:iron complex transport system permease protein
MRKRKIPFLLILIFLTVIGFFASLMTGSAHYGLSEIWNALWGKSDDASLSYILFKMRLPRTFAALLTGAVLAIAGTIYQSVLRNPMADPFVLGISSGGSLGAAVAVAIGLSSLSLFSMGGALVMAGIILVLAAKRQSQTRLILTGVVMNYLCSAVMMLIMMRDQAQYQRILFWTMGSLSSATGAQVIALLGVSLVTLVPLFFRHKELDMLLLDPSSSLSLGLDLQKYQLIFLVVPTLSVALSVSLFGVIGFIGLIAPHIARIIMGPEHKKMLPLSAWIGAILLLVSDVACRVLLPSGEMPIGIVTSLIGTPLLLLLLHKGRYSYG